MGAWVLGALPGMQDRASVVAEVRRVLDGEVPPGAGVLLAVSGGADSVALAHLVPAARPDLRAVVAHVRHGLRDDHLDAEVAAAHAGDLGLRYEEERAEVRRAGEGLEAAARRARYAALARIGGRVDADTVLVGHTADDQAETVLLNLARGSGLAGVAGMAPARTVGPLRVVRPLLRVRRGDVRAVVEEGGLRTVEDPMNADPRLARTQARHHVMPTLGALGADPVGALARLADLARADAEALEAVAAAHASRLVRAWGPARALRRDELDRLPEAVASRVVRLMLGRVRGGLQGLSAVSVGRVLDLRAGQAADVSGAHVTAGGGWLAAVRADRRELEERPLQVPGVTVLPELGVALRADEPALPAPPDEPGDQLPPGGHGPTWALLPVDHRPFVVRARRPGDRIRLAGGHRKVQDVLVDAGVPRALRGLVPVVADEHGEVWWVAGVRAGVTRRPGGIRVWLTPG